MSRERRVGLVLVGLIALVLVAVPRLPEARAQRDRGGDAAAWEYKVAVFSYNPGERLTDDQRAAAYEKILNDQARQGWEPVGSLLSRNVVQTVGGGVATRDSTSFIAYRRPRK